MVWGRWGFGEGVSFGVRGMASVCRLERFGGMGKASVQGVGKVSGCRDLKVWSWTGGSWTGVVLGRRGLGQAGSWTGVILVGEGLGQDEFWVG